MRTVLPANWVAVGYGVPQVCSRHGEPAVEGVRIRVQSRPPGWSYFLLLLGALPFLIVVYATRKTISAASWPFCARCKSMRVPLFGGGMVGVVGGDALVVGGASASGNDGQGSPVDGLLLVLGLAVGIAGTVVAAMSGRTALARAGLGQDGMWVEVLKPARRFAERAAGPLQQAGAQQAYAPYAPQPYGQQAYAPQPAAYLSPGAYPPPGGYQQPGGSPPPGPGVPGNGPFAPPQ